MYDKGFGMFKHRLYFIQPLVLPFFPHFLPEEEVKITGGTGDEKEGRLNDLFLLWM